jgi:WD40 repeat protein
VLEAVEPELTLGGEVISKSKKPKKFTNNNKNFKAGSHTDSVISLSLNASNLGVLASGSADSKVKIWDIAKQANVYTADHHTSKVNKVSWNQVDMSILFTCSEDKTISILDSRFPGDKIVHKTSAN